MIDLIKKKILVTGAQGFLGRYLVKNLLEKRQVSRENLFLPTFEELDLRKGGALPKKNLALKQKQIL